MKKIGVLMIAAATIFAGCDKEEENGSSNPVLSVDKTTVEAAYTAGSYPVAVTSNTAWTAAVSAGATWCTVSPATGTNDGTVTVNVAAQPELEQRIATVIFTAGTLTCAVAVTQAGTPPVLEVDETPIEAAYTAGSYSIAVTSNTAWTAAVSAGATWCTVSPATGTNDGTVAVNVLAQPEPAPRAATITIAAGALVREVAVTQAGAPPVLEVDETPIEAAYTAGSYSIAVTSNTAWTAAVSAGATWCTVSPATGTNDGTVAVNVLEQPEPAPRAATITIAAGALVREVAVTQAAPPAQPPASAASTQTWTYGTQTWSDRLVATPANCSSTATLGMSSSDMLYKISDGRYFYTWKCVDDNKATLCPSPWRVPVADDFTALINWLTETGEKEARLIADWGTGGYAMTNKISAATSYGSYWSATGGGSSANYLVYFTTYLKVDTGYKYFGYQVRCVQ
jgi:uncharacterized protein (TIGR02145 family)